MNITDLPLELRERIIIKYDCRDIIENSNNEELICYLKDKIKLMISTENWHWLRPYCDFYKYNKIMTKNGYRVVDLYDIRLATKRNDKSYVKWIINNCDKFYNINNYENILLFGHQYNNYIIIKHFNKLIYKTIPIYKLREKCIWKYIVMSTTKKYRPIYSDINIKVNYSMTASISICGILLYCYKY